MATEQNASLTEASGLKRSWKQLSCVFAVRLQARRWRDTSLKAALVTANQLSLAKAAENLQCGQHWLAQRPGLAYVGRLCRLNGLLKEHRSRIIRSHVGLGRC